MQPSDKILVTGAAGFIGSALVHELNRRGWENLVLADMLGCGDKWRNLVPLRFVDYVEASELFEALDAHPEITVVFHLGACSDTAERDASYLIANNTDFSRRLCRWALEAGRRFVYASSAATYGDGSRGMDDDADALESLRPLNAYGYSKHLFDLYAKRNGWLDRIVGLKYFNVFGPNEDHKGEMRSVVHKAYGTIRDAGHATLFRSHRPDCRDGEQQRDFIYVKDAVDATLHLAAVPDARGLFNVGTGVASTWLELVAPIFAATGKPVEIRFVDMPEVLRSRYQYRTCADIARLKACGWAGPRYGLADAVKECVEEHLAPDRRLGE